MNSRSRWTLWAALPVLLAGGMAQAGSIFAKAAQKQGFRALHADDTASKVGDIVTIVINERTEIENETERDLSKKSSRTGKVTGDFDLLGVVDDLTMGMFNLPKLDVSMGADTKFEAEADYDNKRKMTDQITATVSDVLPNGNLVVIGTRERRVAGDSQIIQVSGVIRPSDITFANSVQSVKVSEFKIVYKSRGDEKLFIKPGWVDRLLNFVNPF
jgi:flagellar L-ring protein FlgH